MEFVTFALAKYDKTLCTEARPETRSYNDLLCADSASPDIVRGAFLPNEERLARGQKGSIPERMARC